MSKTLLPLLTSFILFWISARFLLPLLSPFLLGTLLALAAEPMVRFLSSKARIPRAISTAIGVSMTFCFLVMILLILCGFAFRQLKNLTNMLPDLENTARSALAMAQAHLLELSSHAPAQIEPVLKENIRMLLADSGTLLGKFTGWLLGFAGNVLTHVPDSALGFAASVLSAFLISAKLPRIKAWLLHRISRKRLQTISHSLRRVKHVLGGWLLAQCKLMSVTFCIVTAGLTMLRIPKSLLWGLLTASVDALPVLGTGTILIPWSLMYLLHADTPRALGLVGIYIAAALTRSVLEPKLLGKHLGLDPLVTLIVLYVGYRLWGVGGMLLAPLITVAALQLYPDNSEKA